MAWWSKGSDNKNSDNKNNKYSDNKKYNTVYEFCIINHHGFCARI